VVLVIVEKLTHKNTDTKSATETCLLIVQRELFPDLRVHKIQITATLCEMQLKRYRLCLITVITQDVRQIGNHVIYGHDFNGICFPQTHLSLPLSLRFSQVVLIDSQLQSFQLVKLGILLSRTSR
jgi:hypothetical protein